MNARNLGRYLADAVRSVLWQTESSLELIVSEASDDDTGVRLVQAFADPRITILRDTARRGWAHGANLGFAASRGDYILFLSGDDVIHPVFLQRMIRALDESGAGTAVAPARAIDDNGVPTGGFIDVPESVRVEPTWVRLFERNHIIVALSRRDVLPTPLIDESLAGVGGDWNLWLRLVRQGSGFAYVGEPLFDYRVHADSLVAREGDTRGDMARVLSRIPRADIARCYARAGVGTEDLRAALVAIDITLGNLGAALGELERYPESQRATAAWQFQAGTVLAALGRPREALPLLEDSSARLGLPETWNNLGVARAMTGDGEGARSCFARAQSIFPDYRDAAANAIATSNHVLTMRPLRPRHQLVR
jgi:hypothetical protein